MPDWTLSEVLAIVEGLWPTAGSEPWDVPGLVVGSPSQKVSRLHLMVDVTSESVDEALGHGADLIIAHHPLLLRGVTSVAESTYKGHIVSKLIRANCALYSAHTNADVVPSGTSHRLASLLGLQNSTPIVPGLLAGHGIGRVGNLKTPISLYRLALQLGDILPATAVGPVVAGNPERIVSRIALCAGAGDSLLGEDAVRKSDVYITSDMRHHPASEFLEQSAVHGGPALINISHYSAEWLWLEVAQAELARALGVEVVVSELNTDPWSFQVQRMDGK